MPYLIGADEAGYGPNLGPLVVSVTAWHVAAVPPDAQLSDIDLYTLLADLVTRSAEKGHGGEDRIAIADSKTLYKPPDTLRLLERGLLSTMAVASQAADDWDSLWQTLRADPHHESDRLPWYAGHQQSLPVAIDRAERDRLADRLATLCAAAGAVPICLRSRALFPEEFNRRVEQHDSKGAVLSEVTLRLVADVLAQLTDKTRDETCNGTTLFDEPVLVVCDKHGGRNRYGPLLQSQFPEALIEIRGESRRVSTYRWGPADRHVEIRFSAGGESFLPTALASMASKYLRELSMQAFNAYWLRHVNGLRPTAGYPQDASRFRQEIDPARQAIGIADHMLWRER